MSESAPDLYQSCLFFQGSLPQPLSVNYLATHNRYNHNTRHRSAYKLNVPLVRTNIASHCITFKGPQLWNAIPDYMFLHNITGHLVTLPTFSSRYKRSILTTYDD